MTTMADRFMREVKRLHQLRQDINEMTPEEADELIRGLGDDAQALALSNGHISRHWRQRAFSGSVKQREGYRSRKGDFTSMPHSGHIHRWYSLRAGNAAERISCVSSRCVERHAGHRRRPHRAAQGRLHRVQARPAPQPGSGWKRGGGEAGYWPLARRARAIDWGFLEQTF